MAYLNRWRKARPEAHHEATLVAFGRQRSRQGTFYRLVPDVELWFHHSPKSADLDALERHLNGCKN